MCESSTEWLLGLQTKDSLIRCSASTSLPPFLSSLTPPWSRCTARQLKLVQGDLEVGLAVVLGRRELTRTHVDLHRRQNKLRHAKLGVTRRADAHEIALAHPVMYMHVVRALVCDRSFPAKFAAPGRFVVVAEKQSCRARERQDAAGGAVQCTRVATGEVGARGAVIGHKERVADEGGVADHIGHAGRGVARGVQGDRVEVADSEALVIDEQMVKLAAVALELGPSVENLAEDVLNDADVLAYAERAAEPFLDVGRSREVVRVDVGLQDPFDLEPPLPDEGDELVRRLCCGAA